MKIAFTGHRNKNANSSTFEELAKTHPGATWVHGGAKGFDSQVELEAQKRGIRTEVHKPDYAANGRGAPFIRNRAIVDSAEVLVALHDGRKGGGTAYTVDYAQKQGKKVIICA